MRHAVCSAAGKRVEEAASFRWGSRERARLQRKDAAGKHIHHGIELGYVIEKGKPLAEAVK